ncbi:endonuclease/exonuclease/phosphatase family protein [Chryseobacterium daecheongense]|uniref:endonuclease/exonuclease/phosphatase family protein n=1 Tax=Chryseobacterium daecheongense TaxID=192389 RepID=UPI001FD7111B|nr:endonuclease/exonuclease/phosphatase family protein [Chryseobacterium daecheongense]UOU99397.1 endonuclease/exonuclease/phosphatase family protein [Chryseobacterium daecheongense]
MKIVRLTLFILHIGIAFLLLGMLLNAYVPPKLFPWFNLLSLVFPVLITTYVLLTLFWIISWKKRAILFAVLGLAFINPVTRWINYNVENNEKYDLKIVSFNTKSGLVQGKKKIKEYIDSLDADIVLLQEDWGEGYDFEGLKERSTDAITTTFSKYKIIDHKSLIKSDFETNNAYANQTDVEINGKVYRIINVYLQPFKFEKNMVKLNGNNEENEQKVKEVVRRLIPTFKKHQEQVEVIKEVLKNSPYPVILAGDLNSVPNSYEYYHLSKGLKDAFVVAGRGSATSFHDYKFPLRIDYVFSSESIKPVSYKVDRSVRLSDHYPVVATFQLGK